MRNISAFTGFVMLSDTADGHKQVAVTKGLAWHGLDDLQATMLEEVLTEFSEEMDALNRKVEKRTVELGYMGAVMVGGQDPVEVDKLRGAAMNKGKGKGNQPA